jgi:hypothetical protein
MGVLISSPTAQVPIPSTTFSAYGTDDQAPVTGQLVNQSSGVVTNGVTVQGPPATTNWVISFTNVPNAILPPGNPVPQFTLTVSDTNGNSQSVVNLTFAQPAPE